MEPTERRRGQVVSSDERMAIRTPEHVELQFLLAGAGNRFLALLVDLIIQWLLFLGIFLAFAAFFWATKWSVGDLMGSDAEKSLGLWAFGIFILVYFGLLWGYFTFFETVWAGQTPGKRRQNIRVIRENGRPIGFAEAAIRNLLRVALDSQPYPLHAIGFITGMLNARFKRLGDFAAGTVVIVERRRAVPKAGGRLRAPVQPALTQVSPRVRQLTREEAATLQAYLRRRGELDPKTQAEMARKIAVSLMQRLGITQPVDMTYEAFLEWLDNEVRQAQASR
jgi:uncharacterized RDD family membrane protein YckC